MKKYLETLYYFVLLQFMLIIKICTSPHSHTTHYLQNPEHKATWCKGMHSSVQMPPFPENQCQARPHKFTWTPANRVKILN